MGINDSNFSELISISESSQVQDALGVVSRLSSDQLRSAVAAILAQPPELSWIKKPVELALFVWLFRRTGFVDKRIREHAAVN